MDTLIGFALLSGLIGALIGSLLPRFSAYFFGPLLLCIALLAGTTLMRTNLHTEGSPAGLIIGGVLILVIAVGATGGLALTLVGAMGVKRRNAAVPPPDA